MYSAIYTLIAPATVRFFFIRLMACVIVMLLATLNVQVFAQSDAPLLLTDSDTRYDINSSSHASGFFIAPENISIKDAALYIENNRFSIETTTSPGFKEHSHYWLYLPIRNLSEDTDWVLHISHFLIYKAEVLLIDKTTQGQSSKTHLISELPNAIEVELANPLGRGISLTLNKDTDYLLVVELSADNFFRPPYIGLMSDSFYTSWSSEMDALYKVAIGIIIGLIIVTVIASIVLRDITFFWFAVSSLLLLFFNLIRSHLAIGVLGSMHEQPSWLWLLISMAMISMLLFVRSFLANSSKFAHLKNIFRISLAFSGLVLIHGVFLPKTANSILFSINSIIIMGVIIYAGCFQVIKEGKYYLIFMLGWLPIVYTIVESISFLLITPEQGSSTLSYKNVREPYIQIGHMVIHIIAMLIRILALKQQKYAAEMRNKAKSDFLASVSHDLRQPLHSMGLFLNHLSGHINSKEGQAIYTKISHLHSDMNSSFKSLMDLSRLEAGAVNLNLEPINLNKLFEKMRIEHLDYAAAKGLSLRIRCLNQIVYSDPLLLDRILRNLLSNAIKYTDTGGVLLSARLRKNTVLIQVWDTGPGIDTPEQELIFDIYKRSEKNQHSHEGTGIGLTIVKQLADFLGHKLNLVSRAEKGSRFEMELPLAEPSDDQLNDAEYSKHRKDLMIYLDITKKDLCKKVEQHLTEWGYPICRHIQDVAQNTSILALIDINSSKDINTDISVARNQLSTRVPVSENDSQTLIAAAFADASDTETAKLLNSMSIHILDQRFRPAQLRSLLRHIECSGLDQAK